MADADEILATLQKAVDELNDTIGTVAQAESDAEEVVAQLSALSLEEHAQQFSAAKDAIEKAREHLSGGVELLDEALTQVQAAKG